MLPALEVQKKPYESSLAPKQTVDGVFCIILLLGKEPAHMWWSDFEQKNVSWVKRMHG